MQINRHEDLQKPPADESLDDVLLIGDPITEQRRLAKRTSVGWSAEENPYRTRSVLGLQLAASTASPILDAGGSDIVALGYRMSQDISCNRPA